MDRGWTDVVLIDDAAPGEWAHRRSSTLLRRWLAETHTAVPDGPLRLDIGPLRLRTEVRHHSPTGGHGFGPLDLVDAEDRPLTPVEPALLAAACTSAARVRAVPGSPINTSVGSLVDWVLHSVDGTGGAAEEPITDPAASRRWLDAHLDTELLPAVLALDPARDEVDQVTPAVLTRRSLAVIGLLGRRGAACEADLLRTLRTRLDGFACEHPHTEWLVRHWLNCPTLTDHALVNSSQLRYRADSGLLDGPPVPFEVPNPLHAGASAPGVPVPTLGDGWSLRPVDVDGPDVGLVCRWMNSEHVATHWNQAWPWEQWRDELRRQRAGSHSLPCIVARDGREIAYVELYRVVHDTLSRCYPHHPHDLGVHIAIGEPDAVGRGLGSALLRVVAEGLLAADPECVRVVAEPNVHNGASIAAFRKAGYAREREVGLPLKNSALMVFARSATYL